MGILFALFESGQWGCGPVRESLMGSGPRLGFRVVGADSGGLPRIFRLGTRGTPSPAMDRGNQGACRTGDLGTGVNLKCPRGQPQKSGAKGRA